MTVICMHANQFRKILRSAGSSAIEFALGNRSSSTLIGLKTFGHDISSYFLIRSGYQMPSSPTLCRNLFINITATQNFSLSSINDASCHGKIAQPLILFNFQIHQNLYFFGDGCREVDLVSFGRVIFCCQLKFLFRRGYA